MYVGIYASRCKNKYVRWVSLSLMPSSRCNYFFFSWSKHCEKPFSLLSYAILLRQPGQIYAGWFWLFFFLGGPMEGKKGSSRSSRSCLLMHTPPMCFRGVKRGFYYLYKSRWQRWCEARFWCIICPFLLWLEWKRRSFFEPFPSSYLAQQQSDA